MSQTKKKKEKKSVVFTGDSYAWQLSALQTATHPASGTTTGLADSVAHNGQLIFTEAVIFDSNH